MLAGMIPRRFATDLLGRLTPFARSIPRLQGGAGRLNWGCGRQKDRWLGTPTRPGPAPINWRHSYCSRSCTKTALSRLCDLAVPDFDDLGLALYNWESRLLFQLISRDVNGTPKFFPRRFVRLFDLSCDDDLIDLEFLRICHDEGYPVTEVPVIAGARHGGESTTRLPTAFRLYAGAYRMWKGKSK